MLIIFAESCILDVWMGFEFIYQMQIVKFDGNDSKVIMPLPLVLLDGIEFSLQM